MCFQRAEQNNSAETQVFGYIGFNGASYNISGELLSD